MSNLAIKQEQKYTYADYKTWNDEDRFEIINGTVYNMSPSPMRRHQEVTGELYVVFKRFLKNKKCKVFISPFDVRLTDYKNQHDDKIETVVQPDIVIVCDEEKLDNYGCKGSPDIVIEVTSPSTIKRDKIEKFVLYEKYGVKEYWIVYPDLNIIEIYKLFNAQYGKPEVYGKDHKIEVKYLGELIIDVNEIFNQ